MHRYSKTRMVYYSNEPSKLKLDTYTDFEYGKPYASKPTSTVTVKIPATANGHNWHSIPYNQLGMYCTEGELQCLVENCSEITFVEAEVCVSNVIPLARFPTSPTSLGLSFNNTIYSLIVVEDTNYVGTPNKIALEDAGIFFRTFDGVSAKTGIDRLSLPVQPLLFKIPYVYPDTSGSYKNNTMEINTIPVNINNLKSYPTVSTGPSIKFDAAATAQLPETRVDYRDLVDAYIPEFLQNNDKVFLLYPGENQFVHKWSPSNNKYNTIELNGPHFDELMNQLDLRFATSQNSNVTRPVLNFGFIQPFPQAKGFQLDNLDVMGDKDLGAINDATVAAQQQRAIAAVTDKFISLQETLMKRDYDDAFTDICPKYFIKGCPIVDNANSIVNHEFLALLTHTIHIEVKPRLHANTNRLQWAMTYQLLERYIPELDPSSTATNKLAYRIKYDRGYAKKPMLMSSAAGARLKMRQFVPTSLANATDNTIARTRDATKLTLNPQEFQTVVDSYNDNADDETPASLFNRRLPNTAMNTGFNHINGFSTDAPQ